jgi:O-methyltransferase
MFYWIPDEEAHKLRTALNLLDQLYPKSAFASDMLITLGKSSMFLHEPRFVESFHSTAQNDQERSLIWRLHVLAWAAKHALKIPGDFVECGVLRGFSSAVLCKYLDFAKLPRKFYLYDTFYGPPKEIATEQERLSWGPASNPEHPEENLAEVRKVFEAYPNVQIVPGIIPYTFAQACPTQVAYLHVDMNSERGEILALEALYDRVVPGGVIVLDDFGWICNRDQAIAELRFMHARGVSILELPTGQGLVIKPPAAASA